MDAKDGIPGVTWLAAGSRAPLITTKQIHTACCCGTFSRLEQQNGEKVSRIWELDGQRPDGKEVLEVNIRIPNLL